MVPSFARAFFLVLTGTLCSVVGSGIAAAVDLVPAPQTYTQCGGACKTVDDFGSDHSTCQLPSFLGGTLDPLLLYGGASSELTLPQASATDTAGEAVGLIAAFGFNGSLIVTVRSECGWLLLEPPTVTYSSLDSEDTSAGGDNEASGSPGEATLYSCSSAGLELPAGAEQWLRSSSSAAAAAASEGDAASSNPSLPFTVVVKMQRFGSSSSSCEAEGEVVTLSKQLELRPPYVSDASRQALLRTVGSSSSSSTSSTWRGPIPENFEFVTTVTLQVRLGEEEQLLVRQLYAAGDVLAARVTSYNVSLPRVGLRLADVKSSPNASAYQRCLAAAEGQAASLAAALLLPTANVTVSCKSSSTSDDEEFCGVQQDVAVVSVSLLLDPAADPRVTVDALGQLLPTWQQQENQGAVLPPPRQVLPPPPLALASSSSAALLSNGEEPAEPGTLDLFLCSSSSTSTAAATTTSNSSSSGEDDNSEVVIMSVLALTLRVDVLGGKWEVDSSGVLKLSSPSAAAAAAAGSSPSPTSGTDLAAQQLQSTTSSTPSTSSGGAMGLVLQMQPLAASVLNAGPRSPPPPSSLGAAESSGGKSSGMSPTMMIGVAAGVSAVTTLLLVAAVVAARRFITTYRSGTGASSRRPPLYMNQLAEPLAPTPATSPKAAQLPSPPASLATESLASDPESAFRAHVATPPPPPQPQPQAAALPAAPQAAAPQRPLAAPVSRSSLQVPPVAFGRGSADSASGPLPLPPQPAPASGPMSSRLGSAFQRLLPIRKTSQAPGCGGVVPEQYVVWGTVLPGDCLGDGAVPNTVIELEPEHGAGSGDMRRLAVASTREVRIVISDPAGQEPEAEGDVAAAQRA